METTMNPQQQPEQAGEAKYKLFNRVTSYPMVNSLFTCTTSLYGNVKESSSLVKRSCESMENGMNWIAEKQIHPMLETELYQKYSTPILSTVDGIGMRSLDVVDKLGESLNSSKQMIATKVGDIKATGYSVAEAGVHRLEETITPIDQYLAGSLLAAPLTMAVNIAERMVDRILPEQQQQPQQPEQQQPSEQQMIVTVGPIMKATHLSQRVQREAFSKLSNLRLRSPEAINAMKVVDLLNYAAENLDNAVKATRASGANKMKDMKDKVHQTTTNAMGTLNSVAEMMSKQVSGPYQAIKEKMKEKTKTLIQLDSEQDIQSFSAIAHTSATKLREAGSSLLTAVHANEIVPVHLIESVKGTVIGVMENLSVMLGKQPHDQHQQQPQQQ